MVETSDAIEMPQTAPKAPSQEALQEAPEPQAPVVDSPPTAPHQPGPASPWWTAPSGKAVDIPAFGRGLLDQILAILFPAPQPRLLPIRVRARR